MGGDSDFRFTDDYEHILRCFSARRRWRKDGNRVERKSSASNLKWLEIVENVSRIAYLILLTFLVLYYATWIRYFIGERKIALLNKSFLLVPIPLAAFPVLYFLCAAVWMSNMPAAIDMLIFGAAHIAVSIKSFNKT